MCSELAAATATTTTGAGTGEPSYIIVRVNNLIASSLLLLLFLYFSSGCHECVLTAGLVRDVDVARMLRGRSADA